jgi:opacity protein-like surface antigen
MLTTLALCCVLEGAAQAQTALVGSIGKVYGGDALKSSKTYAVALGGTGAHSVGSELEFSQVSHFNGVLAQDSKVLSLMASILVSAHAGPVRPYGLFGYGFIRQRTETSTGFVLSNLSNNDVGYNVGAGVTYKFSRVAGVRMDLRHFKVRKADGLSFQRIMLGIVLGS